MNHASHFASQKLLEGGQPSEIARNVYFSICFCNFKVFKESN